MKTIGKESSAPKRSNYGKKSLPLGRKRRVGFFPKKESASLDKGPILSMEEPSETNENSVHISGEEKLSLPDEKRLNAKEKKERIPLSRQSSISSD